MHDQYISTSNGQSNLRSQAWLFQPLVKHIIPLTNAFFRCRRICRRHTTLRLRSPWDDISPRTWQCSEHMENIARVVHASMLRSCRLRMGCACGRTVSFPYGGLDNPLITICSAAQDMNLINCRCSLHTRLYFNTWTCFRVRHLCSSITVGLWLQMLRCHIGSSAVAPSLG